MYTTIQGVFFDNAAVDYKETAGFVEKHYILRFTLGAEEVELRITPECAEKLAFLLGSAIQDTQMSVTYANDLEKSRKLKAITNAILEYRTITSHVPYYVIVWYSTETDTYSAAGYSTKESADRRFQWAKSNSDVFSDVELLDMSEEAQKRN